VIVVVEIMDIAAETATKEEIIYTYLFIFI